VLNPPSSITCAFEAISRATRWRTRTARATGGSTATLLNAGSAWLADCMPRSHWESSCGKRWMHSIRPQSTCACRHFLGRRFARPKRQRNCTRCSICADPSSRPQHNTGPICDQSVVLTVFYSCKGFETPLRRIRFRDPESDKPLVFLTNNFALPALTITKLYRLRWRVELFFKWIKQHLRIKAFFDTAENAVKSQIWIAISVYVLVAIVRKRLQLSASLYEILQILNLTMFERTPLGQLLTRTPTNSNVVTSSSRPPIS
jgi:hypothetical protein